MNQPLRDTIPADDKGARHEKASTRLGLIAGFVGGFLLVVLLFFVWFVVFFSRSGW